MNVVDSNTYWNEKGLFQSFVNMLEPRLPGIGYTSNVYVNIFIAMSHLYYDAYNNGGCNIEDCYMGDFRKHVVLYLDGKVDLDAFIDGNSAKMEAMMNDAIYYIKDKNLEFPLYSCWVNHREQTVSFAQPPYDIVAQGGWGGWFEITYGDIDDLHSYTKGYRDVTEQFVRQGPAEQKGSLDALIYSCELVNKGTSSGNNRDCADKNGRDSAGCHADMEER